MSTKVIERELADVKQRLAKLEAAAGKTRNDGWRSVVGTSEGDDLDREAARLGEEYRAKQNRRK